MQILSQITILINIFSFIFFVGACYQLVAAVAVRIKSMANIISGFYPPAPYRGNLIRLCGKIFDSWLKSPLEDLGVILQAAG
jgi:hypothetical protein